MKKLTEEDFEDLNGGHPKDVPCALGNMAILGGLFAGPAGWTFSAGLLWSTWTYGCYEPVY